MHSTATLDKFAKIITVFILLLLLFIGYQILDRGEGPVTIRRAILDSLLFFVVMFCYFYSIKGYGLQKGKLVIERPIGKKVIPLKKLKSIYDYKKIEKGFTIRSFGNGGLFGYFGYFNNSKIGRFKLFSTKRKDFYILDFGKEKIGISPDDSRFIEALREFIKKEDPAES